MFEINKNAQRVRNNPVAQLRMPFVLKAAAQFDELLKSTKRHQIEQAIEAIANGQGVR